MKQKKMFLVVLVVLVMLVANIEATTSKEVMLKKSLNVAITGFFINNPSVAVVMQGIDQDTFVPWNANVATTQGTDQPFTQETDQGTFVAWNANVATTQATEQPFKVVFSKHFEQKEAVNQRHLV